jgi:hypothetical protein
MIQNRLSQVSIRVLKRRAGRHLLAVVHKAAAQLTIVHSFGDGSVTNDGAHPADGLVLAPNGDFYGTILVFESHNGYVLSVGTSCCGALIHSFGIGDGINPYWCFSPRPQRKSARCYDDGRNSRQRSHLRDFDRRICLQGFTQFWRWNCSE